MASVKVIFRASSPVEQMGTLYYRIIHKRKVCQIHTGNRIVRDEWDCKESRLIICGTECRQEYLKELNAKIEENVARLEQIVSHLDASGREYTAMEVVAQYESADTVVGFISFARIIIAENRHMGKISAAGHYSSALNSFIRFNGDKEISFDNFDSQLMVHYEQHLKEIGICPNTTSYYMRKLRAIYNQAVDRNLTVQRNPFRHVYTGMAKTGKRAVPLNVIKALKVMDLKTDPLSELARDMFLFSFYTRGMSIVDMSYLRKSNLQNGILSYRRKKTGQQLSIRWEMPMQEIVKRHEISDSDFLLPLIKCDGSDNRRQYLNAAHLVNRRLKKLGTKLGLVEPLTMYCARHAWASIALENNIPLSVISRGMGHDSEKTTRIYLASLDTAVIDKANIDIINLVDV